MTLHFEKIILAILAIVIVFLLVLPGCHQDKQNEINAKFVEFMEGQRKADKLNWQLMRAMSEEIAMCRMAERKWDKTFDAMLMKDEYRRADIEKLHDRISNTDEQLEKTSDRQKETDKLANEMCRWAWKLVDWLNKK